VGTRTTAVEDVRAGEAEVAFVTGTSPEVLVDGAQLFSARAVVTVLG
jgi:hypothetical protein